MPDFDDYNGDDDDTNLPPVDDDDADDGGDADVYDADYCKSIAVNNWCAEKNFVGKCSASCKEYEKNKGSCFDEAQGCVAYKAEMCKPNYYPDERKKTCGKC
eukprot:TRINITY_DN14999_c0_g1_i1.p2 TRINITY_DN14999_c0_g1~~TRINITY_DN14999_c0_g1_i1.p2  ORF type:complete len:102 (-),score=39.91 TRINITY_DN14999_c0_g1_i1:80-385(-)